MVKENGRVVAVDNDAVWVETINRSACGTCAAEKGCGQSLLAKWAARSAYIKALPVGRDPASFRVNDRVSIGIPENIVAGSSLLIYCLPLLLLLLGGAAGEYSLGSEGASIAGALSGLLAGGLMVRIYSRLTGHRPGRQPVILDLLPGGVRAASDQWKQ